MGCACQFDTSECACSAHDCVGPVVGAEDMASVRDSAAVPLSVLVPEESS